MNEIEDRLRESLRSAADAVSPDAVDQAPVQVRRRSRVRQLGVAATFVVLATGLIGGVWLIADPDRSRPILPSGERDIDPSGESPGELVAEGTYKGSSWRLSVAQQGEVWCVHVTEVVDGEQKHPYSHCSNVVPDGVMDAYVDFGGPTYVFGAVLSDPVASVRFQGSGIVQEEPVIDTAPETDAPFDVFMIALDQPVSGEVLALDAGGIPVATEPVAPRQVPPSLDPVVDTYGNQVALHAASDEAQRACGSGTHPGEALSPLGIRCFAASRLEDVAPQVEVWWNARPEPGSAPSDYSAWWDRYPLSWPVSELQLPTPGFTDAPPTISAPEPGIPPEAQLVATGSHNGERWSLFMSQAEQGVCIGIATSVWSGSTCPIGAGAGRPALETSAGPRGYVYGLAPDRAREVLLESPDGSIRGEVFPNPLAAEGIEQVFLVTYDGSRPPGDLVALDAGGREVDRVPADRIAPRG